MAKKIGILTFSMADNYGAILQAYALKYTLLNMGNSTHVINFYYPKTQRIKRFFYGYRPSIKWLVRRILFFIFKPLSIWYRQRCFTPFRQKYMQDTPPIYKNTLSMLMPNYDLFITGSDQVFNPRLTEFDEDFFLAFSKDTSKNASYAASFGLELNSFTNEEKNFIKKHLQNIKNISVREEQGLSIVHSLIPNQNANVHIDPTLLLSKEDWKKIAQMPKYKAKYCLVYLMRRDKALLQLAKKMSKKQGWQVVIITSQMDLAKPFPCLHALPTVEQWVGLFLQAEYVFTNSFHGLAFAINFNRPFMTSSLEGEKTANSRLINLLKLTGLEHRTLSSAQEQEEPIDWNFVNQQLDKERQKSFAYLQEITK